MVVKKPLEKTKIEALINRGAHVRDDFLKEEKNRTNINLRIPTRLLNGVDEALKDRVGISRTGWILEAIQEKLKRIENI